VFAARPAHSRATIAVIRGMDGSLQIPFVRDAGSTVRNQWPRRGGQSPLSRPHARKRLPDVAQIAPWGRNASAAREKSPARKSSSTSGCRAPGRCPTAPQLDRRAPGSDGLVGRGKAGRFRGPSRRISGPLNRAPSGMAKGA